MADEVETTSTTTDADVTVTVTGDGGQQSEETQTQERTFTQADLDRLIKDRLQRERQKYQDYNDLRKKAEELDQLKESEMSEIERLQKQLDDQKRKAEEAEKTALATLKKSSIIAEASKLNFVDPGDAYALLAAQEFEIEAGEVKGVSEAVKALAESKPHLIKSNQAGRLESFNPAGQARSAENDAQRLARLYRQTQGESPIG